MSASLQLIGTTRLGRELRANDRKGEQPHDEHDHGVDCDDFVSHSALGTFLGTAPRSYHRALDCGNS
jgi:hypothetical protein